MTKREKVKKGLDLCLSGEAFECKDCPYDAECKEAKGISPSPLRRDALDLLKEQEAVKPKSKVRHGANGQIQHWCGNCMTMLHGKQKFCSECGRAVNWE